DVTRLQLAGRYMLGEADHLGSSAARDPSGLLFLLDTKTGRYERYTTEGALDAAARRRGIAPDLEPVGQVQFPYSLGVPADIFFAGALRPPLAAGAFGLAGLLRPGRGRAPVYPVAATGAADIIRRLKDQTEPPCPPKPPKSLRSTIPA